MEAVPISAALALAVLAALTGGIIARRLRQSTLAGYVIAGGVLAVLPFGPDRTAVLTLADIGVVLLMFSLGIQFDLRELAAVQRVALPGAILQVVAAIAIGTLVATGVGWSWEQGVFFGAAAAITGSTVLSKLLTERGEEDSDYGRMAVGWSVAQDMLTIALVVFLSALGGQDGDNPLRELAVALAVAVGFVAAMVVVGTRLLPWVLDRVARENSPELFILAVAALSIGAALVSESAGLSLALGAFVAGLVVSEPDLSAQILGELLPTRDIFAALFFVSIGLLVDPLVVWANIGLVAVFTVVVLAAKSALATIWLLVRRVPVRTALLTGAVLAPSAEFSFVLARLGKDEGVLTTTAFEIVVAATAASIVFGPLLFSPIPWLVQRFDRGPGPEPSAAPLDVRTHVVVCGAGRVGGLVADTVRRRGFRCVVIERDRRLVQQLRADGQRAIYGSAGHIEVLRRARLDTARTLVLAIPDPIETRQAIAAARALNPRLDIVVRAASVSEATALRALGVAEAVVPEREVALELTRHTLHRLGLTTVETQAVVQGLRLGPE